MGKTVSLLDELGYSQKEKKDIQKLWQDDDCRYQVQQALGHTLALSSSITISGGLNQLCLLTSQAQFAASEEESIAIAVMVLYCMRVDDIFPSLETHRGKAFAARSLISLSLFKPAMEERTRRHGAPSPNYYREVGKVYFKQEEMTDIAEHFCKWENFIAERFA